MTERIPDDPLPKTHPATPTRPTAKPEPAKTTTQQPTKATTAPPKTAASVHPFTFTRLLGSKPVKLSPLPSYLIPTQHSVRVAPDGDTSTAAHAAGRSARLNTSLLHGLGAHRVDSMLPRRATLAELGELTQHTYGHTLPFHASTKAGSYPPRAQTRRDPRLERFGLAYGAVGPYRVQRLSLSELKQLASLPDHAIRAFEALIEHPLRGDFLEAAAIYVAARRGKEHLSFAEIERDIPTAKRLAHQISDPGTAVHHLLQIITREKLIKIARVDAEAKAKEKTQEWAQTQILNLLFGDEAEDAAELLNVFKTLVDLATLAAVVAEAQAELKAYGKRPTLLPHAGRPYRLDIWYPTTLGTLATPTSTPGAVNISTAPNLKRRTGVQPVAALTQVFGGAGLRGSFGQTGSGLRAANQAGEVSATPSTSGKKGLHEVALGLDPMLRLGIEADINWALLEPAR